MNLKKRVQNLEEKAKPIRPGSLYSEHYYIVREAIQSGKVTIQQLLEYDNKLKEMDSQKE